MTYWNKNGKVTGLQPQPLAIKALFGVIVDVNSLNFDSTYIYVSKIPSNTNFYRN